MILTKKQLEATAYIFEYDDGNDQSSHQVKIIKESGIGQLKPVELETIIINGLSKGLYDESSNRIDAYWVLSKRHNKNLIPFLKKRLGHELKFKDSKAIYQLLIALENLEEPVFGSDRKGGSAVNETNLNLRDATNYLKNGEA